MPAKKNPINTGGVRGSTVRDGKIYPKGVAKTKVITPKRSSIKSSIIQKHASNNKITEENLTISQEDWSNDPIYHIAEWERNGYNDSDFYALQYNARTGALRSREVGTTRFAGPIERHPFIKDAPEDVQALAIENLAISNAESTERMLRYSLDDFLKNNVPAVGREVKIVRGRKIPKGTLGVIAWRGQDNYRSNRWTKFERFGIDTEEVDESGRPIRVFVPDDYVECTDKYEIDEDKVKEVYTKTYEAISNSGKSNINNLHSYARLGEALVFGRRQPEECLKYLRKVP